MCFITYHLISSALQTKAYAMDAFVDGTKKYIRF